MVDKSGSWWCVWDSGFCGYPIGNFLLTYGTENNARELVSRARCVKPSDHEPSINFGFTPKRFDGLNTKFSLTGGLRRMTRAGL
jgi:hypothetical protein